MESEEDKMAWRKLMQAAAAHEGHDASGQGSPITELVWQHHDNVYFEVAQRNEEEN